MTPRVAQFVTVETAATELACSRQTVLRAIRRGHITGAVQYGRLVRIPRASLDAFLAAHRVGARP